jgi:hypothetical protein
VGDRFVRNLTYLEDSASTARVLNLRRVHRRMSDVDAEHGAKPFFKNPVLNRAIVLKHRVRRHEKDLFHDGRSTATKIILPMDGNDLRIGGQSVLVGQVNYDAIMRGAFGESWLTDRADRELLGILDELPSLDPFLLRECLKRYGREPARCYFEISDADMASMYAFVEHEIQKLIDLCYKSIGGADTDHGARLVRKILSNAVDAETEPLRLTLRLEKREYQEGVFCWKGFLYYKWNLAEFMPSVSKAAQAITIIKPVGPLDAETKAYLQAVRDTLVRAIGSAIDAAEKSLGSYDSAFDSLVEGRPQGFRDFLLSAPAMFWDLGERLGAVSHIVSFWKYRFPGEKTPAVGGPELCDIFSDFEASLAFRQAAPNRGAAPPIIVAQAGA